MTDFLWQAASGAEVDQAIMRFMAGDDVVLDRVLFPHDIKATVAHVRGLHRIDLFSADDCEKLCQLLEELLRQFNSGSFLLDDRFEDGHSAIESWLTEQAGDLGARVHTGRSRNDQVAVATRLYMLQCLQELAALEAAIAGACLNQAEAHAMLPMPGYTHLQRAVPSSVGLWLGNFAESFTDDLAFAHGVYRVLDANPLGTAAGYGVNLPLDRNGVAAELGFSRLQLNPMAVQNARGKFELMALQAALHAMLDLRRLAWDLSLFTTSEFDFVHLPDQYTTGSSIMPNKRNPDVVELLRGQAAVVEGAIVEIQALLSLPSGYQRDLQLTKPALIRGMESVLQSLRITPALIAGLEFNAANMRTAITPELFATDIAILKAAAGVPFRDAYRMAKEQLAVMPPGDPLESLEKRISPGACGDLQLVEIRQRLDVLVTQWQAIAPVI
ncbi:MAG: argininosuccinate lyase [Xanthomonadales bacterium]|nr:argininosuccinate lyase [Xanthomonadales bacterium]